MKNSPGFIFPHTYPPKTHPISYFPIRIRPKRTQFYTQTVVAGHFGAYAIRPYTGTCKFRPVLDPNLRRRTFQGVCFCALHGYTKKMVWFHISAYEYTQNPPSFILPHTDTPKTHPVLGLNLWRGTFGGVCNTPLHGYMKNLTGFTFPHLNTSKTHPVLGPNLRRKTFGGVCNTPLHGYMKNPAGFRPKSSSQDIWGSMQYAPTRVHPKNCLVSYFRTRISPKRTRFHPSQ